MNRSKLSFRAILLLACAAFLAAAAQAQYRAGIQGTVTDATGAVVKGVKITVTSQETGKSQDVISSDSGFYSVAHLAPGRYTVMASLAAFKTKVIKDVGVAAEATIGVNILLETGAVSEQVTVNGSAEGALQTEDASLTGTVTNEQIQNLPQFRGDPFELLRVTPGVFGQGARDTDGNASNFPGYSGVGGSNRGVFQIENAVQVSANGSRVEANGYQIDGIGTNSQAWGGASVITPNMESVKEIKVEVSPYSAENSHGAGAVVDVVSQNGTNQFHGSGVFRLHSPGLNSFQRWGGPNGASPNRENLLLRDYLGSFGGPILKNKLFAFFSFDHLKTGGGITRVSNWVETPQWIGNLPSGSLAAKIFAVPGSGFKNAKFLPIQGVSAANPDGTGGTSCAQLGLAVSTTTCQDSTGLNGTQVVTGGVDLGSNTGSSGTLVTSATGGGLDGIPDVRLIEYDSQGDNITATQWNGRVDFNPTKKDLVAFSMYYQPQKKSFLPGGWVDGRQYDQFNTDAINETAAVLWNRTINSTTVNEARFNVTRWKFDEIKSNPQAPFGVPIVNITIPQNTIGAGFPLGPGVFAQTTYTFRDTLSKVHGAHVLKFGGEIAKEQNNSATAWGARPSFDFNNLFSFANDAPIDEGTATFDPKTGVPSQFRKYIRVNTYGFFGQDTWKVKPNLTLTLGLRYDYFDPLHDKFGRLSNIVLGTGANALTDAKIKTGGDFTTPYRPNFGPQLGFAWSPRSLIHHEFNNRFVLRGGAGLAYNRVQEALLLQSVGNPPDFIAANFPDRSQVVYGFSSEGINAFNGFPANPAVIQTFDPNTGLPQPTNEHFAPPNITGPLQNLRTPYTVHYSLEGEYDLGHNWVAAVSYEGSTSHRYPRKVNEALFAPIPTAPNPFSTPPNQLINLLNSVNIIRTDVNAHYNALLTRITHRMSSGLLFGANYRVSQAIDECSSGQDCKQTDPFDIRSERGPSDFDVRHSFNANVLYELPFFKSRHDWLYTIAGGWKLSSILTFNSGFPWTPTFQYVGSACNFLQSQHNYNGDNCTVRAAAFLGGASSDFSTSTFQKLGGNFPGGPLKFFTPPPDPRTFTTLPLPAVGRNSFRGPRYTGIDMSFEKRFTLPKMPFIGENAGFEIQANAFNIFNKLNVRNFGFNSDSTKIGTGDLITDPNNPNVLDYVVTQNSNFGRATGALGGRVVEFRARFSF